jgi:hypothetical protein
MTSTSPEEVRRRFKRGREERAFWAAHYLDLLARYPDEWVAVENGEVIARAAHVWDLVQELEARGKDPRTTWTTFLNATDRSIKL